MLKGMLERLLVAIASLYVSRHMEHHCHGEHCHVCHHIHRCLELITVCLELVMAPFVLALRFFFFKLVSFKNVQPMLRTPVSQKVLLLN